MNNNYEKITVVHDFPMVCALIEKYDFKIIGSFKNNKIGESISTCFASSGFLSDAIEEYETGKLELPIKAFMEQYESLECEFSEVRREF